MRFLKNEANVYSTWYSTRSVVFHYCWWLIFNVDCWFQSRIVSLNIAGADFKSTNSPSIFSERKKIGLNYSRFFSR
jgi:hypothetical protein